MKDKVYLEYCNGRFEAWVYAEGRKYDMGRFFTISDAQRQFEQMGYTVIFVR
jgi:hypothetical protein